MTGSGAAGAAAAGAELNENAAPAASATTGTTVAAIGAATAGAVATGAATKGAATQTAGEVALGFGCASDTLGPKSASLSISPVLRASGLPIRGRAGDLLLLPLVGDPRIFAEAAAGASIDVATSSLGPDMEAWMERGCTSALTRFLLDSSGKSDAARLLDRTPGWAGS